MPYVSFAGRGQGEMGQKIHVSNRGTSSTLMQYLDKEEGVFFDRDNNKLTVDQATQLLDGNTKYLDKSDSKFHSHIFAPSQKELKGLSDEKLIELGHADMDEIAKQFNRSGVKRETMVYVLRLERDRYFEKGEVSGEVQTNEETGQKYIVKGALKKGEERQQFDAEGNKIYYVGDKKPGDNRHVHSVISGQIDREKLPELKAAGEIEQKVTRIKISPNITSGDHKKGQGVAKAAFNRVDYINAFERRFDTIAGYDRPYAETFEYARIKNSPNVSTAEKVANEQKRVNDESQEWSVNGSGGGLTVGSEPQKTEQQMEEKKQPEQAVRTAAERLAEIKTGIESAKPTTRQGPAEPAGGAIPGRKEEAKPIDLSNFTFDKDRFTQPKEEPKPEPKADQKQDQKRDQGQNQGPKVEPKPELKQEPPKKSRSRGI